MILPKINKADWRFVPVNADEGFDPKHNEDVIERTIKATDEVMARKHWEAVEKVRERSAALATFFEGIKSGRSTSNVNNFFGKKELARLRGTDVRDQLDRLRVLSKDGRLMRKVPS